MKPLQEASPQTLFDDGCRADESYRKQSESSFDYLNRSAREEVAKIRNVLEAWFSRFPSNHQKHLMTRFRSKDDRTLLAAFFELYIHELLCCLGMDVEVHSEASIEKKTAPDFKVSREGKALFYLEAVLAAQSDTVVSTGKIKAQLYDILQEKLHSPNFFIGIREIEGAPTTAPAAKQMVRFLEERLNNFDPEVIAHQFERGGLSELPDLTWQHEGWQIIFYPIPKPPKTRGKPGVRPIGMVMEQWSYEGSRKEIRGAIRKKATKYGNLDLPYFVAVNALGLSVEQNEIEEALFGDRPLLAIRHSNGLIEQGQFREPNGIFYGPKGPQNTRVSGALIVGSSCGLWPWNVAAEEPVLWHNPWASLPFALEAWPLSQIRFELSSSRPLKRNGLDIANVLNLSKKWPRD